MKLAKALGAIFLALLIIGIGTALWLWPRSPYADIEAPIIDATRLAESPIIDANRDPSFAGALAENGVVSVTYPSVIAVPEWIEQRLGSYYLYFAHATGQRIRLAVADQIYGPYIVAESGSFALDESGFPTTVVAPKTPDQMFDELRDHFSVPVLRDHLISNHRATVTDAELRQQRGLPAAARSPHIGAPDVVVDAQRREILMFYTGLEYGNRRVTRLAASTDGISFVPLPGSVPSPYVRSFRHGDHWYLLGSPGVLYRADDVRGPYTPRSRSLFEPNIRHAGILKRGDFVYVFWSRIGDAPERLLVSEVDLSGGDWDDWQASQPTEVMRAVEDWEGAGLTPLASVHGELTIAANDLRDPYPFVDEDGVTYLFYVAGGERRIGAAILIF